ncbi:MAG: hypothetical protein JSV00_08710 [bacterium]|nr:MAG: hypothetical protein JSV00_08710 [bacterium]
MLPARFQVSMASILLLAALMTPSPMHALAESTLPDGCLGTLQENQIVIYYFHRKFRCQACGPLEETLRAMVQGRYEQQFRTGVLAMCVINLDEPENRHFLDDFRLLSNSLVIAEKRKGVVQRFTNLEAIWDITEGTEAIAGFLHREVSRYLPGS